TEGLVCLCPRERAAGVVVGTIRAGVAVAVGVDVGDDGERPPGLVLRDTGELPAAEDLLEDARLRTRQLPHVVGDEAVRPVELRHAPLRCVVEVTLRLLRGAASG